MTEHPAISGVKRRRNRATALLLGLVAFGFFAAFILASVLRGSGV